MGPGNKEKLPQVEADAVGLGELSQSQYGECAFEDKASEESVGNMMRYAGKYGLRDRRRGCANEGPRATAFFPDTPSRCAAPEWKLYKVFPRKRMVRPLAAQSLRIYGLFRGSLCSGGCVSEYAARAQALSQVLVFMRLLPTASPENKVMVT